jgi:hypothetical protein
VTRATPSAAIVWDVTTYRIVVQGEVAGVLASAFEGMSIAPANGRTTVEGDLVDQAQLQGLLSRMADLGLALVSVTQIDDEMADRRTKGGPHA